VFAERVGRSPTALPDLALSVAVAAAVTLPWSAWRVGALRPWSLGLVAASAVAGIAVPYLVDTVAARISSARVVGTLFSIDPMMGLLLGWLFLGQRLAWTGIAGIALVVASGAALVWFSKPLSAGQRDGLTPGGNDSAAVP
jgi:inner membrane transporter RhtA